MVWWGRRKVRTVDILDDAITRAKILDDTIYTDKILEYHADVSNTSGGAATTILPVSHNLGSSRIYGATLLSHASGFLTNVAIGLVNASQINVVWRASHLSGADVVVSGIGAHVFVMV